MRVSIDPLDRARGRFRGCAAALTLTLAMGCITGDVYDSWVQRSSSPDAFRVYSLDLPSPAIEWSARRRNSLGETMHRRDGGHRTLAVDLQLCSEPGAVELFTLRGDPILEGDVVDPPGAGPLANLSDEKIFRKVEAAPCRGVLLVASSKDPETQHLLVRSSQGDPWLHERIVQRRPIPWHAWPRIVIVALVELPFVPLEFLFAGLAAL